MESRPDKSWLYGLFRLKSNFEMLRQLRADLKVLKDDPELQGKNVYGMPKKRLLTTHVATNTEGEDGPAIGATITV